MEKKLRALLLQALGTEKYLKLVSKIYIRLIKAGMMKGKYPELFYLQELIKPGFICIDIGANVGYYSTMLSKQVDSTGHVHAVEPVALFQQIFTRNMKLFKCENVTLHPVALGGEKGAIIMGTPVIDGVFRHGLTHVVELNENTEGMHTYTVNMCTPEELFSGLNRLDFIKCDVEGYEVILMPHFAGIINRFKPVIQIELGSEEHRRSIVAFFALLGYKPYKLNVNVLEELNTEDALQYSKGDFYFTYTN
jgi:FkbM family methyltransferase